MRLRVTRRKPKEDGVYIFLTEPLEHFVHERPTEDLRGRRSEWQQGAKSTLYLALITQIQPFGILWR